MKTARIMEIQRFCIHDGPGIRTTVFFKGCGMRCQWCHNPESWDSGEDMLFYEERCIGCKECEKLCKRGAHRFTEKGHQTDLSLCRDCPEKQECIAACPTGALAACGRSIGEDELLQEVLKDVDFYGEEGGVTCSGGEPLLQHGFLAGFLRKCREKKINTCIDTALNVEWEYIEELLEYTDMFLVDIKAMDTKLHRRLTEVGNERILYNLKKLSEEKKPVIIRMPLIPGINDTKEETGARRDLLKQLSNICRVDCFAVTDHAASKYRAMQLPFHPFGQADADEAVKRVREALGTDRE